jgi:primosomal protein N' (replication factor Y)
MSQPPLLPDSPPPGLATVVVPPLDGEFLYSFDPAQHASLHIGSIVSVPLGRRTSSAFVVSLNSEREAESWRAVSARNIRVRAIDPSSPPILGFHQDHLTFFDWMAKYYVEPLSKILDLAIPTPALGRPDPLILLAPDQPSGRLGPSQQRLIEYLSHHPAGVLTSTLRADCQTSSTTLSSLIKKGILIQSTGASEPPPTTHVNWDARANWEALTEEQRTIAQTISHSMHQNAYGSFLLHGVTGSGKTEVYLEVIIDALKVGKTALVMVPEIALTPQLTERFESRLQHPVAVLHSNLTPRQRWLHWHNLLTGKLRVAIGARSALFAPLQQLGVIIVDEEHDPSFKQGEGIRYHARDLALVRAKIAKCPIVLGSATPALETFQHARTGKHTYQTLSRRFYGSSPLQFQLIDLNKIYPREMPSKNISLPFLNGLRRTVERHEQAFVLYNRRGFASYLQCSACAHVLGCPHCSVTLTFHRQQNSLLCHLCGHSAVPPLLCKNCGAAAKSDPVAAESDPLFAQRGAGTERVHEELSLLMPGARIAKLDRDVASSIDDYTEVLRKVREREIDILVGTQMIAKGHDLPLVTFVGVVDCDVGLHMPDFRAGERAFQLLTQVSGRAGRRDLQGYVVLQTRVPQHTSLQTTMSANYLRFAETELKLRQELRYPPFYRLIRLIISAEDRTTAQKFSAAVSPLAQAAAAARGVTMLGPAPAPIEKVRNLWRYHILFKSASAAVLQGLMQHLKSRLDAPRDVRLVFDIDPQDML